MDVRASLSCDRDVDSAFEHSHTRDTRRDGTRDGERDRHRLICALRLCCVVLRHDVHTLLGDTGKIDKRDHAPTAKIPQPVATLAFLMVADHGLNGRCHPRRLTTNARVVHNNQPAAVSDVRLPARVLPRTAAHTLDASTDQPIP